MTSNNGSQMLPEDAGSIIVLGQRDPLVSLESRRWLELMFYCFCCGTVAVFGSVSNLANIIVFLKQGYSNSVTNSFLGLAVSDLISLLALVWLSVCYNPWFAISDIPFKSYEIQYLTVGMPRLYLSRVTCWITAFITFERCLSIAIPLKVKIIMKTSRTVIVILIIYILMIISVLPVFIYIGFGPRFSYQRNKTLIALGYYNVFLSEKIEDASYSLSVFSMVSSFVIVTFCATILIQNLLRNSKWRCRSESLSFSGSSDQMSFRERKVIRTVTAISVIFIVCYLPSTVNDVMMVVFSSDYSTIGPYQNTLQATWSVFTTLEAINSSVGIIVYYKTSSKYRAVLNQLCFNLCHRQCKQ